VEHLGRGGARGLRGVSPPSFFVPRPAGTFEGNPRREAVLDLAQAVPAGGTGQPAWLIQVAPIVFIFAVFYVLMIRPARKRQKEVQQMLDALKTGDKVITSGGLLGTVAAVDRNIVQLRVADKVKVDVTKSSIVGLQDAGTTTATEP